MEREEIERVERELDAILKLVQPEPTIQDKAREEALSKEPVTDGEKKTSEEKKTYGIGEEEEWLYERDSFGMNSHGAGSRRDELHRTDSHRTENGSRKPQNDTEGYAPEGNAADNYAADNYAADNNTTDNYATDEYTSEEDEYGMEEENETAGQDRQQYDKRETGMSRTGNRRGLRLLKPSDGLVAAFFVPVVAMIIIFAQRGIFPFGEECLDRKSVV